MSKQERDRKTVERMTERFVQSNRAQGIEVPRSEVRKAVVKQMIRRDIQGKNK